MSAFSRFTPLASALPSTVPFVGPEAIERQRGLKVEARIGANENGFGPAPSVLAAMREQAGDIWKYNDPENFALKEALAAHAARTTFAPTNLLDPAAPLPAGADAYWLSQFLDCFGEDEIVSILSRVRAAMRPDSRVFILETFWDLQRHEAARFCVIGTSLYFACIANGNSRMYHSKVMTQLASKAGLAVSTLLPNLGVSHSLMELRAA